MTGYLQAEAALLADGLCRRHSMARANRYEPARPATIREVAPGVFYTSEPVVLADAVLVEFLREQATSTPLKRARLCAHPSPDADQHDMLIASHRDTYVTPHRHRSKSESFLIIDGRAELLLFEADGTLTEVIPMSDAKSGSPFFYRMPQNQYHSLRILSDVLVFAESSKGPFVKSDMEDAPFAPASADADSGRAFVAAAIEAFHAGVK